jgi:hypothetical protein
MNEHSLMQAIANLIKVKGRHHTEQAYKQLVEAYDTALAPKQQAQAGEADEWHDAVLAECMKVESCYVSHDPAKTVANLIDWHVQAERDLQPQPQAEDERDVIWILNTPNYPRLWTDDPKAVQAWKDISFTVEALGTERK